MTPFGSPAVKSRFDAYPVPARSDLLALRELIFAVARSTAEVGEIEETLKWGEPAYLTTNGAGSTVRIDWKPKAPTQYALYFDCHTTLVDSFRTLFPSDFVYSGNRALILELGAPVARDALVVCLAAAFTYHTTKRRATNRAA